MAGGDDSSAKWGGVIGSTRKLPSGATVVLFGVGLNLAIDASSLPSLPRPVTSFLHEFGWSPSPLEALSLILSGIDKEIREEAVKCRHCGSFLDGSLLRSEWVRLEQGRMVAGVCAGLAEHFNLSATPIRLAFVIAFVLGFGTVLILYVVLWILMPLEDRPFPPDRSVEAYLDDPGAP